MNRETFERRTRFRAEIVERVRVALEPVGFSSVKRLTGCTPGTLQNVLNRENQDYSTFAKKGPPSIRMGGADLAAWLSNNLKELSASDAAGILRAVAVDIEGGEDNGRL